VIEDAVAGAQSGGVFGAIVAVVIDLFARFERFGEILAKGEEQLGAIIAQLNEAFSGLADGFLSFMNALDPLNDLISSLLSGPIAALGHAFDVIGRVLGPVFGLIDRILGPISAMAPLFVMLAEVLTPLLPVLRLVGALFDLIGVAFGYLSYGIQKVTGFILDKMRELLMALGMNDLALQISKIAIKMNENADAAKQAADDAWTKLGQFNLFTDERPGGPQIADETKGYVDDLGKSANKAATGLNKLSEAFTNVPQGFKTALRTFQAMDPAQGPISAGGIGLGGDTIHIHVGGSLVTENQLAQLIEDKRKQTTFRKKGKF